jgi:hypothetical protein
LKVDEPTAEDNESGSFSEDDNDVESNASQARVAENASSIQSLGSSKERKPNLLLGAWSNGTMTSESADGVKEILKCLLSKSAKLSGFEPQHAAEEITRVGNFHFLQIEVRNIIIELLMAMLTR